MTDTNLKTNSKSNTLNLVMAALCLAISYLLPFITGQIQTIGNMLCPMHIGVLLCAFIVNWKWATGVGFICPLLRSVTLGMPPMMPVAISMAFELATYGLVAGILNKKLKKNVASTYIALIVAMICGRIVWGVVRLILTGVVAQPFTWEMFLSGAVLTAIPGIVLQLILIPLVVFALRKANVIK